MSPWLRSKATSTAPSGVSVPRSRSRTWACTWALAGVPSSQWSGLPPRSSTSFETCSKLGRGEVDAQPAAVRAATVRWVIFMANLHRALRRELPAAYPDVGDARAWSSPHRRARSHRDPCDRAACRHRFRAACRRLGHAARRSRRHAAGPRRRHAARKRCRHAARSHGSRCERARRCGLDHARASPTSGYAAGSSRRSARWRFAMKMTHLTVAALTAAGCASTSPRPSFEQVSKLVEERGGKPLHWDEGTPANAQVQAHVRDLLRGTLTPEGAVEVALLRNQGLIATYEELGVAQADLVQAGLLHNPTFGARVRFPTGAGLTATEFSVAEDFLGIF